MSTVQDFDVLPLASLQIDELGCLSQNRFSRLTESGLLIEHVTMEVPKPIAGANDAIPALEVKRSAG